MLHLANFHSIIPHDCQIRDNYIGTRGKTQSDEGGPRGRFKGEIHRERKVQEVKLRHEATCMKLQQISDAIENYFEITILKTVLKIVISTKFSFHSGCWKTRELKLGRRTNCCRKTSCEFVPPFWRTLVLVRWIAEGLPAIKLNLTGN